jgi:rsbT co-antagonist protein RsbR
MKTENATLGALLATDADRLVAEWLAEAFTGGSTRTANDEGMRREAMEILGPLQQGVRADGDPRAFDTAPWAPLRQALAALSASRAAQGASAGETSVFVLALKKPLFSRLQEQLLDDPRALAATLWWLSLLVDRMAQHTVNIYQRTREDIINRQQQELLELSTPVVKLWDGVLAVPMIGTLDSSRTQLVMETLLQRIVETSAELAIVDITGVPTVDTLVAQHLLKTVTAIRLMGADSIISGIRPQIAQTIVHLGIDLQGITTKATLADALALALKRTGHTVSRAKA